MADSYEASNLSSGEFEAPRYGKLRVNETVIFPEEFAKLTNVLPIISHLARLKPEDNPCSECPTIFDAIRLLSMKSSQEPEDMGMVYTRCRPDEDNPGFYEVLVKLREAVGQTKFSNVRCQLLQWITEKLARNQPDWEEKL